MALCFAYEKVEANGGERVDKGQYLVQRMLREKYGCAVIYEDAEIIKKYDTAKLNSTSISSN